METIHPTSDLDSARGMKGAAATDAPNSQGDVELGYQSRGGKTGVGAAAHVYLGIAGCRLGPGRYGQDRKQEYQFLQFHVALIPFHVTGMAFQVTPVGVVMVYTDTSWPELLKPDKVPIALTVEVVEMVNDDE